MSQKKEMIGLVFGRLTVVAPAEPDKQGNARWLCSCTCGRQAIVRGGTLRAGKTSSCGCYQAELLRARRSGGAPDGKNESVGSGGYDPIPWDSPEIDRRILRVVGCYRHPCSGRCPTPRGGVWACGNAGICPDRKERP